MQTIELVPDLENCIETVTKKQYTVLSQMLLTSKAHGCKIERKLEILRLFLETADFRKLRADSEKYLIEGKSIMFMI